MCDTGGTICKVAKALHDNGANEIYACFSHAILSGKATENLKGFLRVCGVNKYMYLYFYC